MAIDVLTLSQSKDYTDSVAMGITDVTVDNTDTSVTFTLKETGEKAKLTFPKPKDGVDAIHYGTDAPTDPNIKVWFNPDGDASGFLSPTATVEQVGNDAKITITDKNGTTEATVKGGTNGSFVVPFYIYSYSTFETNCEYTEEEIKYYRIPLTVSSNIGGYWVSKEEQTEPIQISNIDVVCFICDSWLSMNSVVKIDSNYAYISYQGAELDSISSDGVLSLIQSTFNDENCWTISNNKYYPLEEIPSNMWEMGLVYLNTDKTELLFNDTRTDRIALKGNHGIRLYKGDTIYSTDTTVAQFGVYYKLNGSLVYTSKAFNNKRFTASEDGIYYITLGTAYSVEVENIMDLCKYIRIFSKTPNRVSVGLATDIFNESELVTPTQMNTAIANAIGGALNGTY